MQRDALMQWMFAGNAAMFAGLVIMAVTGFSRQEPRVLTVERLNIVDSTGHLSLVLSNGARLPGGTFAGKEYPQSFVGRGKSAGMIFYNEGGDEVGGLIYEGGVRVWDRPTDISLERQFALADQLRGMPPGPARDSVNQERL